MNSIIALITDFGTKDYFVGAMKGVILSINKNAGIVDITHEIAPQNIHAAGFTLRACYADFPIKTIFVTVVDPGVGSERKAILVETEHYYFIAPDNGLLSFVFDETNDFSVYELSNDKFFKHPVSRTFHGRDVFAPVAAHLSNGASPSEFGAEINDYVVGGQDENEALIVHIDRFGNLITNLKREDLPTNFFIEINGRRIEKLRNFYAESEKSEVFMIFGSAGFLEVVAFQDSAQKLLNSKTGNSVKVKKL